MRALTLSAFMLPMLAVTSLYGQKTAILCKALIDGTGAVIDAPAIIIEGDHIVAVEKKQALPPGSW
ncbi:hypothetical protein Q4E93_33895 [Flavitalea sp. BT771]|uniref:hypothetical protein n=1 Tax=Flavitalea sp. BT771 TaxID=3063329 RepID=UPI0026E15CC9|nr:hypothetical protein [Flavitalea sp. BT771]MDO6435656.1 hypothetical protein [Flavitalea sp. BT771]MDV6224557.1 hypothetical protein [Flavitalea sp. BT771]